MLIGGAEQRLFADPKDTLTFADVFAAQMVELGAAHTMLELRTSDDLPEEGIGGQQYMVIEKDVVDAYYALLAQHHVVRVRIALMQGKPDGEVGVVIEISSGGDDPVDEAMLD